MHITNLIEIIRDYIDEPATDESDWDDDILLKYSNLEHKHLFSKIRSYYEDYFGRRHVFPLVTNQFEYWLPQNMVSPRVVEVISAGSVSGTYPFYTVNDQTAQPQEVGKVELNDKQQSSYYTNNPSTFVTGYFLFDQKLHFEASSSVTSSLYCRMWYLPTAPDLHRATPQAVTDTTITLGSNTASTTLGTVRNIDQYYQNMFIEIESGTGAGQIRRVESFVGSTLVAELDSAWTTNPDTSSVYSIVSPIIEDYQELIALGAVIRAKGIKIEDDASVPGMIYQALMADMTSNLERRNQQYVRKIRRTGGRKW